MSSHCDFGELEAFQLAMLKKNKKKKKKNTHTLFIFLLLGGLYVYIQIQSPITHRLKRVSPPLLHI